MILMGKATDKAAKMEREMRERQLAEDPIKSHDGMDIDPHTAVVESCGYGYRNEVAEDVREAFRQDMDDDREIHTEMQEADQLQR